MKKGEYQVDNSKEIRLTDLQNKLCEKLDAFYSSNKLFGIKPSQMYRGAIYARQSENRGNPDWMSQSASSLRGILYPFGREVNGEKILKKESAFDKFGSSRAKDSILTSQLGLRFGQITELAHHGNIAKPKNSIQFSASDFDELFNDFERVLFNTLEHQLDLHKKIREFLAQDPAVAVPMEAKELIAVNFDARSYFFARAGVNWIVWLRENDFFEVLKKPAKNPESISYRMPELNYLVQVAEFKPKEVADVILATPISKESFNPEVVDQFLWVCSKLPVDELKRVIPRVKEDRWFALVAPYGRGYALDDMFKKLAEAKDGGSILTLAGAILKVKSIEEVEISNSEDPIERHVAMRNIQPFYGENISRSEVLKRLTELDGDNGLRALELLTKTLGDLAQFSTQEDSEKPFKEDLFYALDDVDLFDGVTSSNFDRDFGRGAKEDFESIVLATRLAFEQVIKSRKTKEELLAIYEKYIATLPDTKIMWRLRLYALILAPEAHVQYLKEHLSRVFGAMDKGQPYYPFTSDPEYKHALKTTFEYFDVDFQHEFINSVFTHFGKDLKDKKEEGWVKDEGVRILSVISSHLSDDDKKRCIDVLGKDCDPNYKPKPRFGGITSGSVHDRAPLSQDDLNKMSIDDVTKKLKTAWTPEAIKKLDKEAGANFLNPITARGLGGLLKARVKSQLPVLIEFAPQFFDYESIHAHYTTQFLEGVRDAVKEGVDIKTLDLKPLLALCLNISKHDKFEEPIDEDNWDRLSGWIWMHDIMAALIEELLAEKKLSKEQFNLYKNDIFAIITYLLSHTNPSLAEENERIEKNTEHRKKEQNVMEFDPITEAINSVRGRAFETFFKFIYKESEVSGNNSYLSDDAKDLYIKVLEKEDTQAILSMLGRYFASVYFRDKEWALERLPKLFPMDDGRLYSAAWEGYLTNSIFKDIFWEEEFQELYKRWIDGEREVEIAKKHRRDPEEGTAVHLALAFVHFQGASDEKKFTLTHPLFLLFWDKASLSAKSKFVEFIGQLIYGEQELSSEQKDNLKSLWEWILENQKGKAELFARFGTWISTKVFEANWLAETVLDSLKESGSELKNYYKLEKELPNLANANLEAVVAIASAYFLPKIQNNTLQRPLFLDRGWVEALTITHNNTSTKEKTIDLINQLIANRDFWDLEKIVTEGK